MYNTKLLQSTPYSYMYYIMYKYYNYNNTNCTYLKNIYKITLDLGDKPDC